MQNTSLKHVLFIGGHDETFSHYEGLPYRYSIVHVKDAIGPNAQKLSDKIYPIDALTSDDIKPAVRQIHAADPVDMIMSFTEDGLLPAAEVAAELGVDGIDEEVCRICIDKSYMREQLSGSEFVVRHKLCHNHNDLAEFFDENPQGVFLKPLSGAGSEDVGLYHDMASLVSAAQPLLDRDGKVLLEEFLDGPMVSAETLTIRGEHELVMITGVTLRPNTFIPEHHVMPAHNITTAQWQQVEDFCMRLLNAVEFKHGPCHIELKITSRGVRLIELNNRVGGDGLAIIAEMITGIDALYETMAYWYGGKPDITARQAKVCCRYGASRSFFKPLTISDAAPAVANVEVVRNFLDETQEALGPILSAADRIGPILFVSQDKQAFFDAVEHLDRLAQ